jgi:CBS domain-containing protein
MTEKRVRHLPVLEGTKMIGIVSIGDIMKWVISAQTEEIERFVRGDYLAPVNIHPPAALRRSRRRRAFEPVRAVALEKGRDQRRASETGRPGFLKTLSSGSYWRN